MSGSAKAGTNAERHTLRAVGSEGFVFARSSVARVRRIVFSLDNDLHRRRLLGESLGQLAREGVHETGQTDFPFDPAYNLRRHSIRIPLTAQRLQGLLIDRL